ncbi:MAG: hypothetical protein ACFFD2_20285 [Promethearchaeota archaeon]
MEVLADEFFRCRLHVRCGVLMDVEFLPADAAGSQIAYPIDLPSTGVIHLAGRFLSHEDPLHGPLVALVRGKDGAISEFQVIGHAIGARSSNIPQGSLPLRKGREAYSPWNKKLNNIQDWPSFIQLKMTVKGSVYAEY